MSEWQEITVNEIKATSKNAAVTGPFGSSISAKFFMDSGVPVIRGSNLSEDIDKRLIDEDLVFISPEKALEFSRSIARKGDLIFTCWGTIAQVGIIDDRSKFEEYVISNKQMKLTPAPDKADGLFLYYLFSSPQVRRQILQNAIGSSVPGFNLGQLKSIKLKLPPLEEQKRITSLLDGLDRKIENLRRQNETLERIAQTLFKHWFVDFEFPNEDGKPYKSSGGEMVRSELGKIPADWRVGKLSELVTVTDYVANGSFASLKENVRTYDSENYALYVRLVDYNNQFSSNLKYVDKQSFNFLSKSQLKGSEIIVSNIGANAGTIFRPPAWLKKPMVLGSNSIMFYSEQFSEYIYYFLSSHQGRNILQGIIGGSAQPKFNKTDFRAIEILIPDISIIKKFNDLVVRLRDKSFLNNAGIRTLTKTRDVLLPKLMSGKLRITE